MKQITLAYLGPEGTYSHEAAQALITEQTAPASVLPQATYRLIAFPNLADIMEAVANGTVAFGLVPAENSIEGAVNLTLDTLAQELDIIIQGEIILDITHHLLSFMTELREIHTVMSHYQALAQCRHFLKKYLPHATILAKESTAEAVRVLTEQKQTGTAAIGSYASHLLYQAPIKWANIGDFPHNQTSFLLIGKKPLALSPRTQKTTFVVFPQDNRPGELYKILRVFTKYQINLCKIVSRPNKKQLGSYLFWLDCELSLEHPEFSAIIHDLTKGTNILKNLGSYPIFPLTVTKDPNA